MVNQQDRGVAAKAAALAPQEGLSEEWRTVAGYAGLYEVSDLGRVRTIAGFVRRLNPDTCGYPGVKLSKAGRGKTFNVHRLVADAFLGPRQTGYQIAHVDGDRVNACVANLAIVSREENERHKERHGTGRGLEWRAPTKSLTPQLADGMTQAVDCGGGAGMSIIDPRASEDGGPEWVMRYGNPEAIRYSVASLLGSYDYLLSGEISISEANRRLRLLRRARAECLLPPPVGGDL